MTNQEQINNQIAGLYVAFFDRAPDSEGLEYWYNVATEDNTNSWMYTVAQGFASHPVFEEKYQDLNDEEFVKAVYQNLLDGVDNDQNAIDYWLGRVDAVGRDGMVAEFVDAVLNYDGDDIQGLERKAYFEDKIDVGLAFAQTLGEDSIPTNLEDLDHDAAYNASINIMSIATELSKEEALNYIETHQTLEDWDNALTELIDIQNSDIPTSVSSVSELLANIEKMNDTQTETSNNLLGSMTGSNESSSNGDMDSISSGVSSVNDTQTETSNNLLGSMTGSNESSSNGDMDSISSGVSSVNDTQTETSNSLLDTSDTINTSTISTENNTSANNNAIDTTTTNSEDINTYVQNDEANTQTDLTDSASLNGFTSEDHQDQQGLVHI